MWIVAEKRNDDAEWMAFGPFKTDAAAIQWGWKRPGALTDDHLFLALEVHYVEEEAPPEPARRAHGII